MKHMSAIRRERAILTKDTCRTCDVEFLHTSFQMIISMIRHTTKLANEIATPTYVMTDKARSSGAKGDISIENEVVWLQWHVTLPFTRMTSHPVESHPPELLKRLNSQKTHWGFPRFTELLFRVTEFLSFSKFSCMLLIDTLVFTTTISPLMTFSVLFWLSVRFLAGITLPREEKATAVIVTFLWPDAISGMIISAVELSLNTSLKSSDVVTFLNRNELVGLVMLKLVSDVDFITISMAFRSWELLPWLSPFEFSCSHTGFTVSDEMTSTILRKFCKINYVRC